MAKTRVPCEKLCRVVPFPFHYIILKKWFNLLFNFTHARSMTSFCLNTKFQVHIAQFPSVYPECCVYVCRAPVPWRTGLLPGQCTSLGPWPAALYALCRDSSSEFWDIFNLTEDHVSVIT